MVELSVLAMGRVFFGREEQDGRDVDDGAGGDNDGRDDTTSFCATVLNLQGALVE